MDDRMVCGQCGGALTEKTFDADCVNKIGNSIVITSPTSVMFGCTNCGDEADTQLFVVAGVYNVFDVVSH